MCGCQRSIEMAIGRVMLLLPSLASRRVLCTSYFHVQTAVMNIGNGGNLFVFLLSLAVVLAHWNNVRLPLQVHTTIYRPLLFYARNIWKMNFSSRRKIALAAP